ncbi:MAG TPA: type II secretion system protein GspG [Polyangiaceae bacterium]|nr:type II secretion system protein GspG [Polyangiaceae bacterium]
MRQPGGDATFTVSLDYEAQWRSYQEWPSGGFFTCLSTVKERGTVVYEVGGQRETFAFDTASGTDSGVRPGTKGCSAGASYRGPPPPNPNIVAYSQDVAWRLRGSLALALFMLEGSKGPPTDITARPCEGIGPDGEREAAEAEACRRDRALYETGLKLVGASNRVVTFVIQQLGSTREMSEIRNAGNYLDGIGDWSERCAATPECLAELPRLKRACSTIGSYSLIGILKGIDKQAGDECANAAVQIAEEKQALVRVQKALVSSMSSSGGNCPRIEDLAQVDPTARTVDTWGTPYTLQCPGKYERNGVDVSSSGPDKQPGNDDDINSWNVH